MPYGVGFMEWLLYDVLQVPPEMVTGVFLKDLVNLILLPSIILLIFLYASAYSFIPGILGKKKWASLVGIAFYLLIVSQGLSLIHISEPTRPY